MNKALKIYLGVGIASAISLAAISPAIIVAIQKQQPLIDDIEQTLLNPAPYQDPDRDFKISAYGNLFQKLGFAKTMSYQNITNRQLANQLKIYHLDQTFTIKVISARPDANLIKLNLTSLEDQSIVPIEITNIDWNLTNPYHNVIESADQFRWNIQAWIKQKLPISFDGNLQFSQPQQLLDLSDQAIKDLLQNFSFRTKHPLDPQQDQNLDYQYQSLNQNDFKLQFVESTQQTIALKITYKQAQSGSWLYDPSSDQWKIQVVNQVQPLSTIITNWQGEIGDSNSLRIDDVSQLRAQNALLSIIFEDQIILNLPTQKLNYSASELSYYLNNDLNWFSTQKQLQTVVQYQDQLFQQLIDPNLQIEYHFGFNGGQSAWIQADPSAYLQVNDQYDDEIQLLGRIKVNDKYYQFRPQNGNGTNPLTFKHQQHLLGQDQLTKLKTTLILKDQSSLKQQLLGQLNTNQDFIKLVQQWFKQPDQTITNQISDLGKILLKFDHQFLKIEQLQSLNDFQTIKANFDFSEYSDFNVINNLQYQQSHGTYNIATQSYTMVINQTIHNFNFGPWSWQLEQDYNNNQLISDWTFDFKNKIIILKLKTRTNWSTPTNPSFLKVKLQASDF